MSKPITRATLLYQLTSAHSGERQQAQILTGDDVPVGTVPGAIAYPDWNSIL